MISENLQDLNYEYIILNEPIKNSAVQYNYFYKLLYSTHIVSLTSIFLLFELNNLSFENDKIKFDKTTLNNMLESMREIDIRGSFEADDEVGVVFTELKDLIESYNEESN
jgi:hypothetical protein